jgi:site-specific recombinase XerD
MRRRAPGRAGFHELRNLAIVELFYSTGIRLSELQGLDVGSVDLVTERVRVMGKGRKERIVPLGRTALRALRGYYDARERLLETAPRPDRRAVFLSRTGRRLSGRQVQNVVGAFLARPRGRGGDLHALAAAHLRDAHAGRGRGPAGREGAAGAREFEYDADLHAHLEGAAEAGVPAGASEGVGWRVGNRQ